MHHPSDLEPPDVVVSLGQCSASVQQVVLHLCLHSWFLGCYSSVHALLLLQMAACQAKIFSVDDVSSAQASTSDSKISSLIWILDIRLGLQCSCDLQCSSNSSNVAVAAMSFD